MVKIQLMFLTIKSSDSDEHIEWSGDNICLKRKHYPTELTDDFREEVGEVECKTIT